MAIQYVGGQAGNRAGSTSTLSVNYALTGGSNSTPQAGDFVVITVVVGSAARNPACAITVPATWTALGQLNNAAQTNDTSMNVSYKFMPGTPDTAFTLPSTGNVADGQAYTVQVWRGVDPTTPMDVAAVSANGSGTGRPDPAQITPTTAGAYVLICGGGAAGTGANYVAPANYTTNFLTSFAVDTTDAMVGSGYRAWTSGAENPAAYTGGTTGATDSWCCYTIALRPAPAVTQVEMTGAVSSAGVAAATMVLLEPLVGEVFGLATVSGLLERVLTYITISSFDHWRAGQPLVVGRGGSFDHWRGNLPLTTYATYTLGAPQVEMAGAVAGAGSATGALSLIFPLVGAVSGAGSATGAMAIRIAITGAVAGAGSSTGALNLRIAIVGPVSGLGTATGDLLKQLLLAGAVSGQGSTAGALAQRLAMVGAVSGAGSATGSLAQRLAMIGAVSGAGSATGALISLLGLTGAVSGAGSASGTMAMRIAIVGSVSGQGSTSGVLVLKLALQGNSSGVGTPAGSLAQKIALLGAVSGLATVFGNLEIVGGVIQINMVGAAAGSGLTAGSLSARIAVAGTAAGQGSATGLLHRLLTLQGTASGLGSTLADLYSVLGLEGLVQAAGIASGDLNALRALIGPVYGLGTTFGNLQLIPSYVVVIPPCPTDVLVLPSETDVLLAVLHDSEAIILGGDTDTVLFLKRN